jgi:hypothetical protein
MQSFDGLATLSPSGKFGCVDLIEFLVAGEDFESTVMDEVGEGDGSLWGCEGGRCQHVDTKFEQMQLLN